MQPTSKHKVSLTHKYKGVSLNEAQNRISNHRRGSRSSYSDWSHAAETKALCVITVHLPLHVQRSGLPQQSLRHVPLWTSNSSRLSLIRSRLSRMNQSDLVSHRRGFCPCTWLWNRIHDTVCGLCLDLLADCMIHKAAAMLLLFFFQRGHSDCQWGDILHFG